MGDFYLSTIDQNFILIRPELNLDAIRVVTDDLEDRMTWMIGITRRSGELEG